MFFYFVQYTVYKIDYRLHLLFNKINPFYLILNIPFLKRKYKKEGIDIKKAINESFHNPEFGLSSIRAGAFIYILTFLVLYSFINLITVLVFDYSNLNIVHILLILLVSILLNEFFLSKESTFLEYFKKFEIMEKNKKRRYYILSILFILSVLIITISSFFLINN